MNSEDLLLDEVKYLRELVSSLMKQNEKLLSPYGEEPISALPDMDKEKVKDHLSMIMGEEGGAEDGLDDEGQGGDS